MRGMRLALVAFVLALSAAASVPAHADPSDGYGQGQGQGQEQQEVGGRSGFWTSRAPAKGGAYRWRLLGIGVALVGITGFVMLRLVKKASSDRASGAAFRSVRPRAAAAARPLPRPQSTSTSAPLPVATALPAREDPRQ